MYPTHTHSRAQHTPRITHPPTLRCGRCGSELHRHVCGSLPGEGREVHVRADRNGECSCVAGRGGGYRLCRPCGSPDSVCAEAHCTRTHASAYILGRTLTCMRCICVPSAHACRHTCFSGEDRVYAGLVPCLHLAMEQRVAIFGAPFWTSVQIYPWLTRLPSLCALCGEFSRFLTTH